MENRTDENPITEEYKFADKSGYTGKHTTARLPHAARAIDWRVPVFAAYLLLLLTITVFHEPWYDEAQAWLIAKNATLKDLLFSIPHYEGHPPLWHLLLRPFAKSGLPYEPCLKGLSFVISGAAIWLLVFRSPLPKPLKYSLPFTYFPLYQYSVISRPYCLLMLAFFLAACAYRQKNTHPWRFVGALMLLCAASSYGIVLAGGIAAVWLLEFWQKKISFRAFIKRLVHARAFLPLIVLLVFALLLVAMIFPAADANGINMEDVSAGFGFRFIFMLFVAPIDALFYDAMDYGALVWQDLSLSTLIPGILIGAVVLFLLARLAIRCKKLPLLLVPHILYALFCAKVYFWIHHLGIWLLFLIFFLWCCCADCDTPDALLPRADARTNWAAVPYYALAIFSVSISMLWAGTAGYADITRTYGHGRQLHTFLEEYNLTSYKVMIAWEHTTDEDTGETKVLDPVNCTLAAAVLPYYPHNIFFNFREGTDEKCYSFNRLPDTTRSAKVISYCREIGMPDVVVGDCFLSDLYTQDDCDSVSYIPVACLEDNYIWKNVVYENYYYVYVRADLAAELGLSEIELREGDEVSP